MMGSDNPHPQKFRMTRHISERALLGYCNLHHILLYYSKENPAVIKHVDELVRNFITKEEGRMKTAVPNIGDFLVLMSISNYSWKDVAKPLIREVFVRNVYWNKRMFQELGSLKTTDIKNGVEMDRLTKTWDASLTSFRLLMFQSYFLSHFGRPSGKTREEILNRYDRCCGRPNAAMKNAIFYTCKKITTVKSWPAFFGILGIPCPSQAFLTTELREAVNISKKRKYD